MSKIETFIKVRSGNYQGKVKDYVAEEMRDMANFVCEMMAEELQDASETHVPHFTDYGEGVLNGLGVARSSLQYIWKQIDNID